jgi:hypothetical protein
MNKVLSVDLLCRRCLWISEIRWLTVGYSLNPFPFLSHILEFLQFLLLLILPFQFLNVSRKEVDEVGISLRNQFVVCDQKYYPIYGIRK